MKTFLCVIFLSCSSAFAQTAAEISALAKTYFRDSAELPMDVVVKTTITNPSGKVKSEKQAAVHMIFHGYSHTGKASANATAGVFDRKQMYESLNGALGSIVAGTILLSKKETPRIEVEKGAAGQLFVKVDDQNCPPFQVIGGRMLFPRQDSFCGSSRYTLNGDTGAGLTFQHFTFNSTNLPAQDRVPDLGDVRILAFQIDEDFQSWIMAGETKPFLLPKRVLVTMTTSKGEIRIANEYTPKPAK